jgi:hypothetical protein
MMNNVEIETKKHILRVQVLVDNFVFGLKKQVAIHDASKLYPPELEIFEIYTSKLKDTTYGSDEYKQYLKAMKPALDHHYEHNSHHPEHYENGIAGMNLIDLVEMFCDWIAASERHEDGDIYKSININKHRFGYGNILESIFKNTVKMFE